MDTPTVANLLAIRASMPGSVVTQLHPAPATQSRLAQLAREVARGFVWEHEWLQVLKLRNWTVADC